MSADRFFHPMDDAVGSSSCPVQSDRSVWMSHWMRTSGNLTARKFNCAPNASGKEELDLVAGNELKILRPGEGLGVMETISSKTLGSNSLLNTEILERLRFGSSPAEHSRETCDRMLGPRPVVGNNFELGKAVDVNRGFRLTNFPSEYDNPSRRFKFLDEGSSENPKGWMRKHLAGYNFFSASEPLQETFVGSSSLVPCKLDLEKFELHKRKSETCSLEGKGEMVSNKKLEKTNLGMLEEEAFKGSSTPFLFNDHSTGDHHNATFDPELFQKMHKCSQIGLSPNRCINSDRARAEKSFYDCYSLDKFQNSVQNVETMRICTTLEEGITGGYPMFSQKSQSFLITKMTDVDLLNECDIFNTTTVIARVNGNTPSALQSVSQLDNRGKGGVVLQALSGSTESEVEGNPEQVETCKFTIKDELFTDADTVEFFKVNSPHSGENYTLPDKVFERDSKNVSHRIDVSSREVESQRPDTTLPDINLENPALPAAARLEENSGHSSSKTQSLDMDIFIAHAEKLPNPKSHIFPREFPNSDPSNEWVRRLKPKSSQSSAQGLKNSNLTENSSEQRLKKYIAAIFESSNSSSEPTSRKHYSRGSMVSETKGNLSKEHEEIATDPLKKNKELLLSHAWIQRWLQDGSKTPQKNSGTMLVSNPHSSRLSVEELQQKQIPSVGAMALMGKAMRGFHPCDLQKKGSFTVWNAKNI